MKKRILSFWPAMLLVCAMLLAGCNFGKNPGKTPGTSEENTTAVGDTPRTISLDAFAEELNARVAQTSADPLLQYVNATVAVTYEDGSDEVFDAYTLGMGDRGMMRPVGSQGFSFVCMISGDDLLDGLAEAPEGGTLSVDCRQAGVFLEIDIRMTDGDRIYDASIRFDERGFAVRVRNRVVEGGTVEEAYIAEIVYDIPGEDPAGDTQRTISLDAFAGLQNERFAQLQAKPWMQYIAATVAIEYEDGSDETFDARVSNEGDQWLLRPTGQEGFSIVCMSAGDVLRDELAELEEEAEGGAFSLECRLVGRCAEIDVCMTNDDGSYSLDMSIRFDELGYIVRIRSRIVEDGRVEEAFDAEIAYRTYEVGEKTVSGNMTEEAFYAELSAREARTLADPSLQYGGAIVRMTAADGTDVTRSTTIVSENGALYFSGIETDIPCLGASTVIRESSGYVEEEHLTLESIDGRLRLYSVIVISRQMTIKVEYRFDERGYLIDTSVEYNIVNGDTTDVWWEKIEAVYTETLGESALTVKATAVNNNLLVSDDGPSSAFGTSVDLITSDVVLVPVSTVGGDVDAPVFYELDPGSGALGPGLAMRVSQGDNYVTDTVWLKVIGRSGGRLTATLNFVFAGEQEIAKALRVMLVDKTGGKTYIYAPPGGTYAIAGKAVGGMDTEQGNAAVLSDVVTLAESGGTAILASMTQDHAYEFDIYVWLEGEDLACTNANAAGLSDVVIFLSFAVSDPA